MAYQQVQTLKKIFSPRGSRSLPSGPFEHLPLGLIPLPLSTGYPYVLVIIDECFPDGGCLLATRLIPSQWQKKKLSENIFLSQPSVHKALY